MYREQKNIHSIIVYLLGELSGEGEIVWTVDMMKNIKDIFQFPRQILYAWYNTNCFVEVSI